MTGLALACDNARESLESATEGVPPAGPAAGALMTSGLR